MILKFKIGIIKRIQFRGIDKSKEKKMTDFARFLHLSKK
jgi:hypothetical protein